MTRNELINDVVRVCFEGGDWQSYLKQLVKEMRKNERIAKRVQPDNKHFKGKQCVDEYYTTKTIFD